MSRESPPARARSHSRAPSPPRALLSRLLRRLRPGGDPVERCVPDVRQDIYFAFLAMYRFALPLCRGRRVLDAGCGTGFGDLHLCEHGAAEVTGIDVDRRAIAYARSHFRHPRLRFAHVRSNHWPCADGSFDTVFSSNVIEHVADHLGYLREVKRALAPGGALVLITPVVETPGLSDHPYHVTNLTPEQWGETLGGIFRHVETFGVHLRAFPQHTVPWLLSPLVQHLAVHPLFTELAAPVRARIHRDLMFNPFGLWEGDFEVEPCAATTRAMSPSMGFVAVCSDAPLGDPARLTMRREPRAWTEEELGLARFWRELRRMFSDHWRLVTGGNGQAPPEDAVWRAPPELWGERRVEQGFRAPEGASAIAGLRICFATFARHNTGTVQVQLTDERGCERARAAVDCGALRDGAFHAVRFARPVPVRPGERLRFAVWSDEARPGNAVTVWTRFDCAAFEPGVTFAEADGAWGGVVHEVLCD